MEWNGNFETIDVFDNHLSFQVTAAFDVTSPSKIIDDANISLELHKFEDRTVGYVLRFRSSKLLPRLCNLGSFVSLHYGPIKSIGHKKALSAIMYADSFVRVLSFGEGRHMDYFFVSRKTLYDQKD